MRNFLLSAFVVIGLAALVAATDMPAPAAAAETRSYVMGFFGEATYSKDNDCPGGPNLPTRQQLMKDLYALGIDKKEIEELEIKAADGDTPAIIKQRNLIITRARIDGKPANPYLYPAAVADPQLKDVTGKFAYGFNLDGKGADTPNGFEDPETHERGVNNELFRALGCMIAFRGSLEGRTTYADWAWGQVKSSAPAWVVTISGENLTKDGPVTITVERAMEHLESNSDGTPRADSTYRRDGDPRSHNVMAAHLKDGMVTLDQPVDFRMEQNFLEAPELRLFKAHMRVKMKPDGTLFGFIGGYQPWDDLYFGVAAGGPGLENCVVGDIPGIYYLLKKHADGLPDPKTGQNTAISATYFFEAIPAFVVAPKQSGRQAAR